MSTFTAKDVQTLRQSTGVGMMDAKKALTETDGDFDKAVDLLRERGLAASAKRADREATEGTIGTYLHQQAGRDHLGRARLPGLRDRLRRQERRVQRGRRGHRHAHRLGQAPLAHPGRGARRRERRQGTEIIAAQAANEGKPENIIPKIVEGRIEKFYAENVLLDQTFVDAEKFEGTVGEHGAAVGRQDGREHLDQGICPARSRRVGGRMVRQRRPSCAESS